MTGKEVYARVRLGYHMVAQHGPVSIAIDKATHQRLLVVKVQHLGEVPVPIDYLDYQNLAIEMIRELGTTYNFTEQIPDQTARDAADKAE